MRKSGLIRFGAAAAVLIGTILTGPAFGEEPYQLAQSRYEIFIDEYGRRVMVDPLSGEIIQVLRGNNSQRQWRNQRRLNRQQRAERRARRRARLEREFDDLYPEERENSDFSFNPNRQRWQDPSRNRWQDPEQKPRQEPWQPRYQDNNEPDQQMARLPDNDWQNNEAEPQPSPDYLLPKPKISRETITKLQVFLDREGFSPGVIDGAWGSNISKAITAWQEAHKNKADLTNPLILDKYVNRPQFGAFSNYTITDADLQEPFIASVPSDYSEKARLKKLAYTSASEMFAERFHMSEAYLKRLNPDADFNRPGETIRIVRPGEKNTRKVHYIVADKGREQLRGYDRNGVLVAAYPATIGSAQTPSPTGKVEVARIALDPEYTYNPKKNFQQGNNTSILTIPPGPNGPVGSVWIALSKPTYGIHGTPNPDTIGKTNSHGCIRLTNWDAQELASLVQKGVTVEFTE